MSQTNQEIPAISEFNRLDEIVRLHGEAMNVLSKTYFSDASRITDLEIILSQVHDQLKRNPRALNLVELAFGKGSRFDSWMQSNKNTKYQRVFKKDGDNYFFTSLRYPIPLPMAAPLDAADAFVHNEHEYIYVVERSRTLLNDARSNPALTKIEKNTIEDYIKQLDILRGAYLKLELSQTGNTVESLEIKFQSPAYETYYEAQLVLARMAPQVLSILNSNHSTLSKDATKSLMSSTQRIIETSNQASNISEQMGVIGLTRRTRSKACMDADTVRAVVVGDEHDKKMAGITALLKSESLPIRTVQERTYRDTYQTQLLATIYPPEKEQGNIKKSAKKEAMLLAIQPLSESFKLSDKAAAFSRLIKRIQEGNIILDKRPAIEQARGIAKQALEVINREIALVDITPELVHQIHMTAKVLLEINGILKAGRGLFSKADPLETTYSEFILSIDNETLLKKLNNKSPLANNAATTEQVDVPMCSTQSMMASLIENEIIEPSRPLSSKTTASADGEPVEEQKEDVQSEQEIDKETELNEIMLELLINYPLASVYLTEQKDWTEENFQNLVRSADGVHKLEVILSHSDTPNLAFSESIFEQTLDELNTALQEADSSEKLTPR
jgi:hypothetical protein